MILEKWPSIEDLRGTTSGHQEIYALGMQPMLASWASIVNRSTTLGALVGGAAMDQLASRHCLVCKTLG